MGSVVRRQVTPTTLTADSDSLGQASTARPRVAASGHRHGSLCLRLGQATRRIRRSEVSAASDASLCWAALAKEGHGTGTGRANASLRSGVICQGTNELRSRRTLTTMVRTGLEKGVKPMVWIETPQQNGLDHTKHHRRQVGAPHAARAVIVLAAHDRVAEYPLRGIIVHRHFRALDKDRESRPVVMQTAQHLRLPRCRSVSCRWASNDLASDAVASPGRVGSGQKPHGC